MKKFNLQLFAEAAKKTVQGKQIVYLYRILEEAASNAATQISFVTENSKSVSKDSESTVTKDGSINTPGAPEVEITSTSILAVGDEIIPKLEDALENDKIVEIWEVNLAEPVGTDSNKFKGRYFQGYLTEFELTASAEEAVEYSHTFAINGMGVAGDVTVTTEQQEMAAYVFTDTAATGA